MTIEIDSTRMQWLAYPHPYSRRLAKFTAKRRKRCKLAGIRTVIVVRAITFAVRMRGTGASGIISAS